MEEFTLVISNLPSLFHYSWVECTGYAVATMRLQKIACIHANANKTKTQFEHSLATAWETIQRSSLEPKNNEVKLEKIRDIELHTSQEFQFQLNFNSNSNCFDSAIPDINEASDCEITAVESNTSFQQIYPLQLSTFLYLQHTMMKSLRS